MGQHCITWINTNYRIFYCMPSIHYPSIAFQTHLHPWHYGHIIMGTIASQITSLTIVYSTVYSDADQRKHQSSASLAFVQGIHRGPVNSTHQWPVTRKMLSFDDVIMKSNRDNCVPYTSRTQHHSERVYNSHLYLTGSQCPYIIEWWRR